MKVARKYLYLMAALIWGLPGVAITTKGLMAYSTLKAPQVWWLPILTALVLTMFHLIFRKMVRRYTERIATLPERCALWQTFPKRGWGIILFMIGLGIALKLMPVPASFTAFFYSGLGPMLIVSAIRFWRRM